MADKRQSKQDTSPRSPRGGGQVVVNLSMVNEMSLVFWSRHRFDLAAEIQVRVQSDVLPPHLRASQKADRDGWVIVRGFVIECRALRRPDGAGAFRVSLLLDAALTSMERRGEFVQTRLFWGGGSGLLFSLN